MPKRIRRDPYRVLSVSLAMLLLMAAGMKAHQLATTAIIETSLLTTRWFLIGMVELELTCALWLWSGLFARQTRSAAILFFSVLASISMYRALNGHASCGCFGSVPVNPWLVFFLDAIAVTCLYFAPPHSKGPADRHTVVRRAVGVAAASLLLGLPAASLMAHYRGASIDAEGAISGDSREIILDPASWVGRRFPLLKHIDVGDRLESGDWLVVLYRHDCPACERALPRYQRLVNAGPHAAAGESVALIELPPFGSSWEWELRNGGAQNSVRGTLDGARRWLMPTPVEIMLSDGIVRTLVDNSQIMDRTESGESGQTPFDPVLRGM